MSDLHDHHDHGHEHSPASKAPAPDSGVEDVSSRALAEALGSSFFFVKIVMVVLIIIFFASGAVTVGPQERAVILRFGKLQGKGQAQLLGPGLHFAFPPPIDQVVKIPIGQNQTTLSTVGWYATLEQEVAGSLPVAGASLNPSTDGYTLTGDGNIVHARAIMAYRVTDALAYVFGFVNASNAVQTTLDSALVWASARMTVDEAIKNNDAFKEKVLARMSQLVDEYSLGITINTMTVTVSPPRFIKQSFDDVTSAEQDRSKVIYAAQGEASRLLATARSEANDMVNVGKTRANAYLLTITNDAGAFSDQLPGYQKNPQLFRQRLLIERWQRVYANAEMKTAVPDRVNGRPYELRILLTRDPEKPRTNAPAQR